MQSILKLTAGIFLICTFLIFGKCTPQYDINREIIRTDSESVTQIIIEQKANKTILDRQTDGNFIVNNELKADMNTVGNFLALLSDLRIKTPASEARSDSLHNVLQQEGLSIQFKNKDKLLCRWYAHEKDPEYKASPFMNAGAEIAFYVEIPGIEFDFSNYCRVNPDFWTDRRIIHLPYNEINQISLSYFGAKARNSFVLKIEPDTAHIITQIGDTMPHINLRAVGQYLTYFDEVSYFQSDTKLSRHETDSIISSNPIYRISIEDIYAKTTELSIFPMPNGSKARNHPHLAYARINNEDKLRVIKYYEIDLLLKTPDYFQNK